MFLVSLSTRPWRQAPLSQAVASVSVGLLLLLAGLLFWLQSSLRNTVQRLQIEQVVTAYFDPAIEEKDQGKIVDEIRGSLGAHALGPEGATVQRVTSSDFVAKVREAYPELGKELAALGAEAPLVAPQYVSIAGTVPESAIERIRALPGIESVESSRNRLASLASTYSAFRWVSKLLLAGVVAALLSGLALLARMNSHLHDDSLRVLRLWGADEAMLRMPALISGAMVGAAGGLLGAGAWLVFGRVLAAKARAISPALASAGISGASWTNFQIALLLLALGVCAGFIAGGLGGAAPAERA